MLRRTIENLTAFDIAAPDFVSKNDITRIPCANGPKRA
jgi:hypothetical protein